jgi:long-subunit fatty acid transport protein
MVVSTFALSSDWRLSGFLLIPHQRRQSTKRSNEILGGGTSSSLFEIDDSDLWLGASVAYKLSPQIRLGLSAAAVYARRHAALGIVVVSGTDPSPSALFQLQADMAEVNFEPILGVVYQMNEAMSVGLRIQARSLRLSGRGSNAISGISRTGTTVDFSGTTRGETHDAQKTDPMSMTVGGSWKVTETSTILLDISAQEALNYDQLPIEDGGFDAIKTRFQVGARAAQELQLSDSFTLVGGLGLSPTAYREDSPTEDGVRATLWTVSLGGLYRTQKSQSGLGLHYIRGNGVLRESASDSTLNPAQSHELGISITTSYLL